MFNWDPKPNHEGTQKVWEEWGEGKIWQKEKLTLKLSLPPLSLSLSLSAMGEVSQSQCHAQHAGGAKIVWSWSLTISASSHLPGL